MQSRSIESRHDVLPGPELFQQRPKSYRLSLTARRRVWQPFGCMAKGREAEQETSRLSAHRQASRRGHASARIHAGDARVSHDLNSSCRKFRPSQRVNTIRLVAQLRTPPVLVARMRAFIHIVLILLRHSATRGPNGRSARIHQCSAWSPLSRHICSPFWAESRRISSNTLGTCV